VFLQFLAQEWLLAAALLVTVAMLLFHESRRAGRTISPQQAAQLINRHQAVVIDLRDAAEFRKGHVVGSMNLPFADLKARMGELEALRGRPIVLVCRLGQTAGSAGKQLAAAGFDPVYRIGGGITEWQHQQMPLQKR